MLINIIYINIVWVYVTPNQYIYFTLKLPNYGFSLFSLPVIYSIFNPNNKTPTSSLSEIFTIYILKDHFSYNNKGPTYRQALI